MDTPDIFNSNTISQDGSIIYPRLYAKLYPNTKFIEDFRPDYFVKKDDFERLLIELYGDSGIPLYRSYISGSCMEVRCIEKRKVLFFVLFTSAIDMSESEFKLSSKDLAFAEEVGDLGNLQEKLDKVKAVEYNARGLAPWISEEKLEQAILKAFYYPFDQATTSSQFCAKYDALKFDRVALKPQSPTTKKKIGFKSTTND
jgi:hypothetical protein